MTEPNWTPARLRDAALHDLVRGNDRVRVVAGRLRRIGARFAKGERAWMGKSPGKRDHTPEEWGEIADLLDKAIGDYTAVRDLARKLAKATP